MSAFDVKVWHDIQRLYQQSTLFNELNSKERQQMASTFYKHIKSKQNWKELLSNKYQEHKDHYTPPQLAPKPTPKPVRKITSFFKTKSASIVAQEEAIQKDNENESERNSLYITDRKPVDTNEEPSSSDDDEPLIPTGNSNMKKKKMKKKRKRGKTMNSNAKKKKRRLK
eukprot:348001_1